MIIGRKGMFFTAIAVLLASVLVLTFSKQATISVRDTLPATEAKAEAANSHVIEMRDSYLPQSLYVAAYTSLYAMSEYFRMRGDYFTGADADAKFNKTLKEMIVNGSMCCGLPGHLPACNSDVMADVDNPALHESVDACIGQPLMKGQNFTWKLTEMENASFTAFRINTTFNRNYNNLIVELFQDNRTGPFKVGINITVNYSVVAGDVMINNTENISVIFEIEGIPDPLYSVESQRTAGDGNVLHMNYFNATNITGWNISQFFRQLDWRMYRHDPNASSFLMRFYGRDEKSKCCGMESLVNPLVMASVNGAVEKPYVDWCYYGRSNRCTTSQTGTMWNVTCITTEADGTKFFRFAIDSYHAQQYNLSNPQVDYLYGEGPPPACPESPFP